MSFCASACICNDLHNYITFMDYKTFTIIKEVVGVAASLSSAVIFIPNIIETCHTRGEKTIPLNFMFLFMIQSTLWLMYGILIFSIPTVLLELFLIGNIFIMFFFKLIYMRKVRLEEIELTPVE